MSRISIFGYYGQDNAGDEAILSALSQGIKKTMPETIVTAYSGKPTETAANHGIEAYSFFKLSPKAIIKGLLSRTRLAYIKAVYNFLKTDLVIIGGGGLYFDNKDSNKWIFDYINLIHLAKLFRKKVALCGISVGPLHHQSSKEAIAQAFIKADLISVRDKLSKQLLIEQGIPADHINVIPDLVFTFNSAEPAKISAILKLEGIEEANTKVLALVPCCYNTTKAGWLTQYVNFCEHILASCNTTLWMVPLQRHDTFDDLSAAMSIYENLSPIAQEKVSVIKGKYAPDEIQGILSKADFVFAERLHGSIMALNTNTPFMGIAYMQKVDGVLELANLPERIIPLTNFLSGAFLQPAYQLISETLASEPQPKELNAGIRALALTNFEHLKKLAER